MRFPSLESVLDLHDEILRETGGEPGVLDRSAVQSALERAEWGPFGKEPDLFDRAAMLLRGICQDHPFADGNKRTAFEATDMFLILNGKGIESRADVVAFMLAVAQGYLPVEAIVSWLRHHAKDNQRGRTIE